MFYLVKYQHIRIKDCNYRKLKTVTLPSIFQGLFLLEFYSVKLIFAGVFVRNQSLFDGWNFDIKIINKVGPIILNIAVNLLP